ncbi:MAG TPA: type II 3-dehydroquinate dehydratase [Rickettsiales bacterium]|nr:type II 3-dehydroquinate dehydratase [Rickettsiales bacterium]
MKQIFIINGPNLNMLGTREPTVYGKQTLDDIRKLCEDKARTLSVTVDFRQSNHEGELITWVQEAGKAGAGIIINPAGFGHTSVALMDALLSVDVPAIEVHLSNICRREQFRHHTYTSRAVRGVVSGFGAFGYIMAIEAMVNG